MKSFQTILIVIFVFAAIIAVIIFGKGNAGGKSGGAVTINVWGTIPQTYFQPSIDAFTKANSNVSVIYNYIPEEGIYNGLVEALASGYGPDAFILSDSLAYQFRDKIQPFPLATLSVEQYKQMFLTSANVFLYSGGVLAIPITVDPLILYYNNNILESNGIAKPPTTWQELASLSKQFNKFDKDGNITQSTISLGEYNNVRNARDIITALSLQGGTKITDRDSTNKLKTASDLGYPEGTIGAMTFYSEFANQKSDYYSWNLGKGLDRDEFLQGKLAFYIGHASEIFEMRDINPNMNFDVAKIPQLNPENPAQVKNYAKVLGVTVAKNSAHPTEAYQFAAQFANPAISQSILASMNASKFVVASPLRSLSGTKDPANPYVSVMYQSAIISDNFVDPNYVKTSDYFKQMISSVNSGLNSPGDAVDGFMRNIKSIINDGTY